MDQADRECTSDNVPASVSRDANRYRPRRGGPPMNRPRRGRIEYHNPNPEIQANHESNDMRSSGLTNEDVQTRLIHLDVGQDNRQTRPRRGGGYRSRNSRSRRPPRSYRATDQRQLDNIDLPEDSHQDENIRRRDDPDRCYPSRRSRGRHIIGSSRTRRDEIPANAQREQSHLSQIDTNCHPTVNQSGTKNYESSKSDNVKSSNVQSEIAESQLKCNNFECMICCDIIHRYNPIWYCSSCYNIFHLKCSIEWCKKSIKTRNEAIINAQYPSLMQADSNRNDALVLQNLTPHKDERLDTIEWPCPACRVTLYVKPSLYKCFCGKVTRPEVNQRLTPHSCGQPCGRKRPNANCPHTCDSICHPGRCTSCILKSKRVCFCGKQTSEIECSSDTPSCEQVCNKPLDCGRHQCSAVCHSGSCAPCKAILTLRCYCGREEVVESCLERRQKGKADETTFACLRTCGKQLDCGNHVCERKCHADACGSCVLLSENIKTCPCGSTLVKRSTLSNRKSCLEPVPTCENKCNRPLICGPDKNHHRCQKKCHTGSCPPCKLKTSACCECRLSNKTIECAMMFDKIEDGDKVSFKQIKFTFNCEIRCNTPKSCGRHRCNNKCCRFNKRTDAYVHRCDQICNRKLACGTHTCQETCHLGQCGDCVNIGWDELRCHCGQSVLYPPIACGARPPVCHKPCRRAHNCGHPVNHECHDDTEKCAPCTIFVERKCYCGAESKSSVHCYMNGYSCGRFCKKELQCKQHWCQRICHDGDCESPDQSGNITCTQPCNNARYLCKHPCNLPCHGRSQCPITECRKIIEIKCDCGNRAERIECHKIKQEIGNRSMLTMLSSSRGNDDAPLIIDLSNKPINTLLETSKRLDCDDSCSIFKRNKALAVALAIAQPDLKPTALFGEDPLRLLKEATVQDYKFVASTYSSLEKLVKSVKDSDKRFIFMQFAPSTKLRREVIHELAHHFNCTSESDGEEPERRVVVRAHKSKSFVPEFNIEQLLPVAE